MDKSTLTLKEKILLKHTHPVNFVAHLIGLLWAGYFLWVGSVWGTLLCFVLIGGTGVVVDHIDKQYIFSPENVNRFQTFLLIAKSPFYLIFHIAGFFFIFLGLWLHSGAIIIFGITLIPFGYLIPWIKTRKSIGTRKVTTERNEFL